MKILIIGGTYFLGRVFCLIAGTNHELTLVNRGRYELKDIAQYEYHFDRHDGKKWLTLPKNHYDVVIDFCAYDPHDIEIVVQNFPCHFNRYILISTVDVYEHHSGMIKNEHFPLEKALYASEIGTYINNKIILEKELRDLADTYHFNTSIIRPGNIYGPFNYAPRESQYIAMMMNGLPLINPVENDGQFQLVYVKDVAQAILMICERADGDQIYNIVSPEILDYSIFYEALTSASDKPIEICSLPYQQAIEMQYPFCYPVFKEESELYDGSLFCHDYSFTYTPLKEGLFKTYQAFYPVFSSDKS